MGDRLEKLYGGEVTLSFNDARHVYEKDGYAVPGVTTILKRLNKPALMPWAAKMTAEYVKANAADGMTAKEIKKLADEAKGAYRKFTDDAAEIGTIVHAYAENRLKGLEAQEPEIEAAKNGVAAFNEWLSSNSVQCFSSERIIFSKERFYAGTADFFGRINGELVVADLKTSGAIYEDYILQLHAYMLAISEEEHCKFDASWIIRLDKKTGKFEAKRFPVDDRIFNAWCALRELHRELTYLEQEYGK